MAAEYDSFDLSSSDEDMDDMGSDVGLQGKSRSTPKRMAEDKLHEKRLKERARRNGMAKSIDQMRLIVPELMDAKKVYSQAKVVAIALQHIYELQRENGDLRQRLGMKPREQEPRPMKGKRGQPAPAAAAPAAAAPLAGVKREAPAVDSADERAKKRRRLEEASAPAPAPAPAPAAAPAAAPATSASASAPKPPSAAQLLALLPRSLPTPGQVAAPVQVRLQGNGSVEEGTLEAVVVDSNSPSSFDDDDTHMVSDTPLTMSPRHEPADVDAPEMYPTGFSYSAGGALWEEHEPAERHGLNPHASHDSSAVDLMLQAVLH